MKQRLTPLFFTFLLLVLKTLSVSAQTSFASGNWSAPGTWVGGVVPAANANVTIAAGHVVNVDITTATVNNVTVNAGGHLRTINTATSQLNYGGTMTVAGILTNDGGINQVNTNKAFLLNGTGSYYHNPKNNTLADESIFINSNETFSNTSNLFIQKWFDLTIGLGDPTRVQSSNFGNITMSLTDTIPWEQDGFLMTSAALRRVFGNLTVTSGAVSMDNGNGNMTFLELGNVTVNGTGRIIFLSGPNRPLTLITGTFTDTSTNVKPTILMDNVFSSLVWTCNGNATIRHNFLGITGTGSNGGGSMQMNVNGNLSITGGDFILINKASAPLTLNVTLSTIISGSPNSVRFVEGNAGALTFNTNNLYISGGGSNIFLGGNGLYPATGAGTITIYNEMVVNGVTTTTFADAPTSVAKVRVTIGDLRMAASMANLTFAKTRGALTVNVVDSIIHTGGRIIGQIDTNGTAVDSLLIGGGFLMNNPTVGEYFRFNYSNGNTIIKTTKGFTIQNSNTTPGFGFTGIYGGSGDLTFTVGTSPGGFNINGGRFTGIYGYKPNIVTGDATFNITFAFNQSAGFFRGIDNRVTVTQSTITFTAGNITYSGGNFSGFYAVNDVNGTNTFTTSGLLQISFNTAATDTFMFNGYSYVNGIISEAKLNLSVSGNFNITGAAGCFISSLAKGQETINILGSLNFTGGKNSFNSYPNSGIANSHPVSITVGTDLAVAGGVTYLSAHNDTLTATVNGNFSIALGDFAVQGGNYPATLNILGGFNQTGGNFYIHRNSINGSFYACTMTVNSNNDAVGDFSQTAGVFNFDDNTTSILGHSLFIKSPSVTYGGTGSITMALPGTNTILGMIAYSRTGVTAFNRTSSTHSIQQIEQHVYTGCTLNVVTGNMQVASLNGLTYNMLVVQTNAVLDLGTNQIFSNALQAYSGMRTSGRIRIARTQGWYDGTTSASLSSAGGMVFLHLVPSVMEYYGSDTQVITGIGVGTATTAGQKYWNLEINFQGTPNTEFVYPTNIPNTRSVAVRNKLLLTAGELNLDNDHDPLSGGRSIVIERDSITAITRTSGYIRSEVHDSTASVIWRVGNKPGPHLIPFGYNSTYPYLPFIFELPVGSAAADTIIVSTYHTTANNLPYPPPTTHVNGLSGTDNSAMTVDRFWYLQVTDPIPTASLTFTATATEVGSIASPRAQRWITSTLGWELPYQGTQSNPSIYSTLAAGATSFALNWWTLSGISSPLPVTLLDFKGACEQNKVNLRWTTGTELNNDKFTVLRSRDGVTYEVIGDIKGSGNSSTPVSYDLTDVFAPGGHNYYKLRQTDFNGQSEEFGPIIVESCKTADQFSISVIPSTPEQTDVVVSVTDPGKYRFVIYTMEGKPIYSVVRNFESTGMNVVTLHHGSLSGAIYIIRVEGEGNAAAKKITLGLAK